MENLYHAKLCCKPLEPYESLEEFLNITIGIMYLHYTIISFKKKAGYVIVEFLIRSQSKVYGYKETFDALVGHKIEFIVLTLRGLIEKGKFTE